MGAMASMLAPSGAASPKDAPPASPTQGNDSVKKALKAEDPGSADQCGLENDGIAWVKNEAPVRKLTCETSPEKQAKYRAILETIFSPIHAVVGRKVVFQPDDICEICVEVKKYLQSEPVFIEDIEAPITIVGDLRGHLHDLDKIFAFHSLDGKPGYECAKYIFLGNYVGRGRQSIEIVVALFILKILYPSQFFLLRGNHEFRNGNEKDFRDDVEARFPNTGHILYAVFNATFCWLSLCAKIGGKIFCAHGGISTNGFTKSSLRNLRKPLPMTTMENYLVHDIVWSDPAEGLKGTAFNSARHTSIYFGEDVFARAMDAIDCLAMFRGHSRIDEGFAIQWQRCITIFSCVDSNETNNMGSFSQLDANLRNRILILRVDRTRHDITEAIMNSHRDSVAVCDEDKGTGKIEKIEA